VLSPRAPSVPGWLLHGAEKMAPAEEERSAGDEPLELQEAGRVLQLPSAATKEQVCRFLEEAGSSAEGWHGVDAAMLGCEIDRELADQVLGFCARLPAGACSLRLCHNDLSSGTDLEQRIFDRIAEREARLLIAWARERDKKFHEQAKRDSAKEKDFAMAAGKRRKAEEGIAVSTSRLAQLDEELADLNLRKKETPWYALFTQMEARPGGSVDRLELSNCCLHATGLVQLTQSLLELEHRGHGQPVSELVLDGNDLGDIAMTALTSYMRLSKHLRYLRIRNVGVTDRGVSQVLSSLVSNKILRLVDLRSNGLASLEVSRAAMVGVERFNKGVEVLLE